MARPDADNLVEAVLELQRLALRWCADGGDVSNRIARAIPELVDAVQRLHEGKRQLNRARRHLVTCLSMLDLKFCERELLLADFWDACRRIDQVDAVLRSLPTLAVAEWSRAKLPPLLPLTRFPEDHPGVRRALQARWDIDDRVKERVRPPTQKAVERAREPELDPPDEPVRNRGKVRWLN
jgi:hypothetical protein